MKRTIYAALLAPIVALVIMGLMIAVVLLLATSTDYLESHTSLNGSQVAGLHAFVVAAILSFVFIRGALKP